MFHPKLVHLPIGLSIVMPLIAISVIVAWWRGWLPAKTWLIAIGLQAVLAGSAFVAAQSGEQEEERVEDVVSEHFIEEHEEAAEWFVRGSMGVLVLMVVGVVVGRRRERAGFALAATSAVLTVAVLAMAYRAGEAGGRLVYKHGAAGAYSGPAAPSPAHDDD